MMEHESIPSNTSRNQVIGHEAVDGIVNIGNVFIGGIRIFSLATLLDGCHNLCRVLNDTVYENRHRNTPLLVEDTVSLHKDGITIISVLRISYREVTVQVTSPFRMILFIILITNSLHGISPTGSAEQFIEDVEVVSLLNQRRQRSTRKFQYGIQTMDVTVDNFDITLNDAGTCVNDDGQLTVRNGIILDGDITVVHIGLLQSTNLEVGGLVCLIIAIIDDGVTGDVVGNRVGNQGNVKIGGLVNGVQVMTNGLVGRCKHRVITTGREQL